MIRTALAAAWLAAFAVFLRCAPGTFSFEDTPELLATASALGNSHEPGYPLLMCLGKAAMLVPAGGPAFRWNLMIAGCGAGAAAALAALTGSLAAAWGLPGPWTAGAFAAGVWALSDAAWWECVIGDKYAPFYLTFLVLVGAAWWVSRAPAARVPRGALAVALLIGVAFAHHQYSVFAAPAIAVVLWRAAGQGGRRGARVVLLGAALAALPVSTKVLYPPIRSAGGSVVDWGGPGTAVWLSRYLTAARYHGALAETSIFLRPERWAERCGQSLGLLGEEFPWPLVAAAPVGAWLLLLRSPPFGAVAAACALLDAGYALNYTEKIVRWYEPAYAVLALAAALGWGFLASRTGKAARPLLAALAVAAVVWQGARGWARNDLSRAYGASDVGRNLLVSLPPRAVYLGAGDQDLFPVWAAQLAFGARPDVAAVGLGSFVDAYRADHGWQRRTLGALGIAAAGRPALAAILAGRHGRPVFIAAEGYSADVWKAAGEGIVYRPRGMTGEVARTWDWDAAWRNTRRVERAYTLRGVAYGFWGATRDLVRVRDEVARDGLMHYARSDLILGSQLAYAGRLHEAALQFGRARALLEPLTGPLRPLSPVEGPVGPARTPDEAQRAERAALASGFRRLAAVFAARRVEKLANLYGLIAGML